MNETSKFEQALKVLSLEDSQEDYEIISEQLIRAGFILDIARVETESEFESSIRSNHYNIILADYNLPNFDAFGALALCVQICPDIPFICVSGSIGEILAIELLKKGAVDYVLKDRLERLPFAVKRALDEAKEKLELKQAEAALKASEAKYRTIFENVQDVFYQTNLEGIIFEVSPTITHLSGFQRDEIIGKPASIFYVDPKTRDILIEAILKKGELLDYEIVLRTKSGEIKYVSINARLIFNSQGMPTHIDGAMRDITRRKQLQITLNENKSRLELAMKSANMAWWEMDILTGKVIFDARKSDMIGYPAKQFNHYTDFMKLVHTEDYDKTMEAMRKHIIGKADRYEAEYRILTRAGEYKWFYDTGTIVKTDTVGQPLIITGLVIDISERKKDQLELLEAKDRAEASNRLKTAFLNNISHEIRTPLNGILGFAPLVIDPASSPEEKQSYLEILNFSSNRLMQTITDYMDISLITSGNIEIRKKDFAIAEVINEIYESFKIKTDQKNLDFSIEKPVTFMKKVIYTDKALLIKILVHLMDNALKFTKQGSIILGVSVDDNTLGMSIKDTGAGIKEEMLPTVFMHFVQEDVSNTRGYEGSGLGLSIAQGLVKLLGGTIKVESVKGVGSTFSFTIPCTSEESYPKYSFSPSLHKFRSLNPTVLIAEDDDSSYFFLELSLKNLCKVLRVENGQAAIDICKTNYEIELVLMDVKMPGISGLVATHEIKKFRKELPIIILTAYAELGMNEKCLEAGCDDYMSKPVKKNELFAKMANFGFNAKLD